MDPITWLVILVLAPWYCVTLHHVHKYHRKNRFHIVATLIITEDSMKIQFTAPVLTAPLVKQTVTFTGGEPNPVSVDLVPGVLPSDGTTPCIIGTTGELTGTYAAAQVVAATLTQTDSLGTVSPATAFDFTLVADAVAAPDASKLVATLVP